LALETSTTFFFSAVSMRSSPSTTNHTKLLKNDQLSVALVANVVSFLHTKDHVRCAMVCQHFLTACKQRLSWFPSRSLSDFRRSPYELSVVEDFTCLAKLSETLHATLSRYSFLHSGTEAELNEELKRMSLLAGPSLTELSWDFYFNWNPAERHLAWIGRSTNLTRLDMKALCMPSDEWQTLALCTPSVVDLRISLAMMPCLAHVHLGVGAGIGGGGRRVQAWPRLDCLRVHLHSPLIDFDMVKNHCLPLAHLIVELADMPTSWCAKQPLTALIAACSRLQLCDIDSVMHRLPSLVASARPLTEVQVLVGSGQHWCGRHDNNLYNLLGRLGSLRKLSISSGAVGVHWLGRIPVSMGHGLGQVTSLHLHRIAYLKPEHFTDSISGIFYMPRLRELILTACSWGYSSVTGHLLKMYKTWTLWGKARPTKNATYPLCRGFVSEAAQEQCNTHGLCRSVFGSGCFPDHLCMSIRRF
jgi:hypothetical protein